MLFLNICIIALAVMSLQQSHQLYDEQAATASVSIARVMEENINGMLDTVDMSIFAIVEVAEEQLAGHGLNNPAIDGFIARIHAQIPKLAHLRFVNARGDVLLGDEIPVGKKVNVADREHFRRLRDDPRAGLIISKPLIGRISGEWEIILARRINRPDGSFAGMIYGAIALDYFTTMFSKANVGVHSSISLADRDMALVIRYPEQEKRGEDAGFGLDSAKLHEMLKINATTGTYTARSSLDGDLIIFSYNKIAEHPLYVLVGIAPDDYLVKWQKELINTCIAVLLICLLSFILVRLVARYIADRARAELALHKSEKQFRSLFENMLDGFAHCKMIFVDGKPRDFLYLEVNSEFEKLTGLKNVVGKKASEVTHDIQQSDETLLETYGRVSLTGTPERFEHYVEKSDTWFYISVYSPEQEHVAVLFQDITETRRAEQEVRFHSTIIKNIPEAVCAIDLKGIVVSWNSAAEMMLGYKADDIIGKPVATIIPDEIAQKELEHCISLLNSQNGFTGYESIRVSKDGRMIPVELIGIAIRDSNGVLKNYASIMVGISNRKKAEEEKLKSHMLESVCMLAGGIAHDFNNLLTIIISDIGIAKMLVESDDKAVSRLANAERVGMLASELSRRLLTFSSEGEPVKKIGQVSDLVVSATKILLKGTNVSLKIDFPDDLYPAAIDEAQIKQVVTNLVNNAKEAMPNGGVLSVRGENLVISRQANLPIREGRYVKISFSDTGVGIPVEKTAKIFDPYYSTKDTFTQKGLGLGLAVCYSMISRHDGLLTVDSEVGKGTTFTIYLPAAG